MSTDNTFTIGLPDDSEPHDYVMLHDYPEITVRAFNYAEDQCRIEYSGWPEDLIAAGVMLAPWATPTGKHPRDLEGGKVSISRRWRLAGQDQPRRYCVVTRRRSCVELARWPGASEAVKAHEKHKAWDKARRPWMYPPFPSRTSGVTSPLRARPVLRLVVDNTRPEVRS